jgi:hypothetical protein
VEENMSKKLSGIFWGIVLEGGLMILRALVGMFAVLLGLAVSAALSVAHKCKTF